MVAGIARGAAGLHNGTPMCFIDKTFSFDIRTSCLAASKAGNLEVLRYLHEQGCPWHYDTCGVAAASGDLEQLKWLHEHGAPLDEETAEIAASGGSVVIFEWLLQQQGVVFDAATMQAAAAKDHLQLCQWLREHGCPWSAQACSAAAHSCAFDTLDWLLDSGCPCDAEQIGIRAVVRGGAEAFCKLHYLLKRGLLSDTPLLTGLLQTAGANNNLAAAKWLRRHGAAWPEILEGPDGGLSWASELVQWARAEGCTLGV
jgi:hypothetical protein